MGCIAIEDVIILSCGVLFMELSALKNEYWPSCELRVLSSMLHMHPEQLGNSLQSVLEDETKRGRGVVLIYGDCCSRMAQLDTMPGVARARGKNCYELLLGPAEYRRISHEGAFFLLPEWTQRWREIFTQELGLNQTNAASIMQDMHKKMVYLDTGIIPVPEIELRDCAEYCGLPYELMPVSLEHLRMSIDEAIQRL